MSPTSEFGFNKYISPEERRAFFNLLSRVAIRVEVLSPISACRDPKDDKFLSVAVSGNADGIITGDKDLLDLNPFLGIPIWTPKQFIEGAFEEFAK